jgi:hypothetical protein
MFVTLLTNTLTIDHQDELLNKLDMKYTVGLCSLDGTQSYTHLVKFVTVKN